MKLNIFQWCDERLSQIKDAGIAIQGGIAVLPENMIYSDNVQMISTFKYRNDIPEELRKSSLLCNFMPDADIFTRLVRMDEDIHEMEKFGGICGQDLSPSVGMLRPRQRFSLLINSIYNCSMAIRGIKILPNSRVGDFGTMDMTNAFPNGVSFITGMHGCKNYGFKEYGLYQLRLIVREKKPPVLYVYGTLTTKEAARLFWCNEFRIITFPDRRNCVRNGAKAFIFYLDGQRIRKEPFKRYLIGGAA